MNPEQFWRKVSDIYDLHHGRYKTTLLTDDELRETVTDFLVDVDILASEWYSSSEKGGMSSEPKSSWLSGILSRLTRPAETPEETESRLEAEADRLEKQVDHIERVAKLQKRIADAKVRIKVSSPAGSVGIPSLKHGTGVKLLVGLVIVIVVIIVISKAR